MTAGLDRVDTILRGACGHQFTAAVARIDSHGTLLFEQAYGTTRLDSGAPVYVDTQFDLASLTKLFITTLVLRAVDEKVLALDEPLVGFFPQWRGNPHERITLRMLLAHTSGMNSGADYRELLDRNVEQFALDTPLIAEPGERVIYSDLGFIALGVLLERIYGRALAAITERVFRSPSLRFRPYGRQRSAIPATEEDAWRGRVQGSVHDEKAYLMGGAAGHAGLFGTAADVALLAEAYLGPLCGRATSLVSLPLVREATREQAWDPTLRRGLGWALKTNDENSCGRYFSMLSFGHTGFVGTCIWVDPQRDVQGVLLTNSVYFGRNDTRDLRAAFYEAIP